jgi:serine/threonine protein phosphatase PrpC
MSRAIQSWSATHPGTVRTQNQDACLCRPEIGLFAVADGVGGHSGGEVASRQVMAMLNAIPGTIPPAARLAAVRAGLQQAHEHLLQSPAATGPAIAPATTVVVLMLHEGHFACLWAGDSRAYLLRDGQLCRLTTDHSVVQDLVNSGALTEAEADQDPRQHVITRAIGAGEQELQIEKTVGEVLSQDRFLLCSDGLYKTLEAETITGMLALAEDSVGDAAERLIHAALAHYARDNVTAVIAAP